MVGAKPPAALFASKYAPTPVRGSAPQRPGLQHVSEGVCALFRTISCAVTLYLLYLIGLLIPDRFDLFFTLL